MLSTIFPQMYGWLWFMIKKIVIVRYAIFVLLVIYEKLYCVTVYIDQLQIFYCLFKACYGLRPFKSYGTHMSNANSSENNLTGLDFYRCG